MKLTLITACGIPDRELNSLIMVAIAILALLAAATWLGIWMLKRGWQGRANATGKAHLIIGGILTVVMVGIWIALSSPFVLNR